MRYILIISGIISAIGLITLALYFALTIPSFGMWFYRWQFDVNNTYYVVNMHPDDLHHVTRHMIAYMQGHHQNLQIATTVAGYNRYFFSDIEIRHMIDVYYLFVAGRIIRNIAALASVASVIVFVIFGRDNLSYMFRAWHWAAASLFGILIIFGTIMALNWDRAWWVFHEIFFDNSYWLLDPRVDLLINIVPNEFFMSLAAVIGGFFAAGLAIIFVAGFVLRRFLP